MNRMKVFLILLALMPLPLFAQDAPQYQRATELTLSGEVLYAADSSAGSWAGIYVIMKDRQNEIEVHLAPLSFLIREGVNPKPGDTIRIVGSRTEWKGAEIVLAREITMSRKTVVLRDAQGQPRW